MHPSLGTPLLPALPTLGSTHGTAPTPSMGEGLNPPSPGQGTHTLGEEHSRAPVGLGSGLSLPGGQASAISPWGKVNPEACGGGLLAPAAHPSHVPPPTNRSFCERHEPLGLVGLSAPSRLRVH